MDAVFSTLRAVLTSRVMILAAGGALGTNARYWLALWINGPRGERREPG